MKKLVNQQDRPLSEEQHLPSPRTGKHRSPKKMNLPRTRDLHSPSKDAKHAVISERSKTPRDQKLILCALDKHFIFSSLTEDDKKALVVHMKFYTVRAHDIVFQQNAPGTHFFIVASGKLEVVVSKRRVAVLGPADNFGELALIHDGKRTATVKTIDKSTLWGLDRKTFREALKGISRKNYSINKNFIDNAAAFSMLTKHQKETVLLNLTVFKYQEGDVIVHEGDPGDFFYLIREGTVHCTQEGRDLRVLSKGEYFGEQALLNHSPRTATVTASTDVSCLAIDRETLCSVFGNSFCSVVYKNSVQIALDRDPSLQLLAKEQKELLIEHLTVKTYEENQIVLKKGTRKGENLLVVLKGKLACGDSCFATFECVGTAELLNSDSSVRTHDLIALECTETAEISSSGFKQHTMLSNQDSLTALKALKKVQLFRGLPHSKLQQIKSALQLTKYNDGETIVHQDTIGDCFFIIKNGHVDIRKDGVTLRTITHLDYFGERSLLFNEPRTASVLARDKVSCWELSRQGFSELFDAHIQGLLIERIQLQDESIVLTDLCVLKLLGEGSFGKVYMVAHKARGTLFAVKCVNRDKIEKYRLQRNVLLEKRILSKLDHPFIVKLVKTFKDSSHIYFLQELVVGLELFDVLGTLDLLSEEDSKLYASCLVLILEHLHERDIIYRDLKPENIMIDRSGYPKLIDFGISKILQGRTSTVIGTPHYMAPEMITGRGYGLEVDWYSLGVILYEFLFGCAPFGADEVSPYKIYEKTIEHKLTFPGHIICSSHCQSVIRQLLDPNPTLRLCGGIKKHTWFHDVQWDAVIMKQVHPPYKPKQHDLSTELSRALLINEPLEDSVKRDDGQLRGPRPVWDIDF